MSKREIKYFLYCGFIRRRGSKQEKEKYVKNLLAQEIKYRFWKLIWDTLLIWDGTTYYVEVENEYYCCDQKKSYSSVWVKWKVEIRKYYIPLFLLCNAFKNESLKSLNVILLFLAISLSFTIHLQASKLNFPFMGRLHKKECRFSLS